MISTIQSQGIKNRQYDAILNFNDTYFEECNSNIYVKGNIAWLQIAFKTKSNIPSGTLKLGDFNSAKYHYVTLRPVIPLINDDTAEPEGSVYLNQNATSGGNVNIYKVQPSHSYIAQMVLFLDTWQN